MAQQGTEIPAEFPPASYDARQYVDSRGCVYVRAGIDGAVNWVPRVSRSRTHLCGAQPSLKTAAAPTPRAAAPVAKDVVQIKPAAKPAAKPVAKAAAPQPVRVTRTAPAPAPATKPKRVVKAPASKPVVRAPKVVKTLPKVATPKVVAKAPAKRVIEVPSNNASGCQGASAISNKYIGNGGRYPVRCGPQDSSPVTVINRGKNIPTDGKNVYRRTYQDSSVRGLRDDTVIVPKHVYDMHDGMAPAIPHGYRPVWKDDRLNPYRAYQTVKGYRDTQMVWSNTVPRRMLTPSEIGKAKIKQPVIVSR